MQPTLHATRWWIHVDTTNRPTSRLPTMDNMVLPIWIACRQQNVHKTHEILQFKSEWSESKCEALGFWKCVRFVTPIEVMSILAAKAAVDSAEMVHPGMDPGMDPGALVWSCPTYHDNTLQHLTGTRHADIVHPVISGIRSTRSTCNLQLRCPRNCWFIGIPFILSQTIRGYQRNPGRVWNILKPHQVDSSGTYRPGRSCTVTFGNRLSRNRTQTNHVFWDILGNRSMRKRLETRLESSIPQGAFLHGDSTVPLVTLICLLSGFCFWGRGKASSQRLSEQFGKAVA